MLLGLGSMLGLGLALALTIALTLTLTWSATPCTGSTSSAPPKGALASRRTPLEAAPSVRFVATSRAWLGFG